jgi:sterol desaturase/sphingolipid hydroxylase (fatty acid hydroxylase superfamily)
MSTKQTSLIPRQVLSLCVVAGFVATAVAVTQPDAVTAFTRKVATRIVENIEWLVQLPANHTESFFVPYLALSFAIALLIVRREAPEPLGWRALLRRVFPRDIYWHRSARVDYAIALTEQVFTPAVLATRLLSIAAFAGWIGTQLTTILGQREPVLSGTMAAVAFTLIFALASDLGIYLTHRLHHSSKLLWQFHRLHHSAEVLTPLTVLRAHPVEQVTDAIATTFVVGFITGICGYWLTGSQTPLTFLGTQLLLVVLNTICAIHLRHTHVWMSWSPALSHILISPAQHQIHHSIAAHHWNKNYGNVFALWDWMFGSLYVPRGREELAFGLAEGQPHATLVEAYLEPFAGARRQVTASLRRGADALQSLSVSVAQYLSADRSSGL